MEKLLKRNEVPVKETWDITRLYKKEEDYEKDLETIAILVDDFVLKYAKGYAGVEDIYNSLNEYNEISILIDKTMHYAFLCESVDMSDEVAKKRQQKFEIFESDINSKISFYKNSLSNIDKGMLDAYFDKYSDYNLFLNKIVKEKKHQLSDEAENILANFRPILEGNSSGYSTTKLADMSFDSFVVDGKEYENSFIMFENYYNQHPDKDIRRAAFISFSKGLEKHKYTVAGYYQRHVLKEKIESKLRGYDAVFDFLLEDQNVSRELYDRQIDVIMEKLAPHMRKYAKLIQKIYGLEKMTFVDLKLPIDVNFEKNISIDESKDYILDGLSVLGEEYINRVKIAYDERWVDFAMNEGKTTGGFCTNPYKAGAYILLSWNNSFSELFTLAHELGHAINGTYVDEHNKFIERESSLYLIEAPSTINELILSKHLMDSSDDIRFKRGVLSLIVGGSYYHNFVTHLLEAAYQREVYKLVDNYEPISAEMLCKIKKEVLQKFWGDAVEIDDNAALTWMRQDHYYMGLYSYTYSASLTIATVAAKNIFDGNGVDRWLDFLKLGMTEDVLESAAKAGVDISTDKVLNITIDEIGAMIDEMVEITTILDKE